MYFHQRKRERKKRKKRPRAEATPSSLSFPSFWHGFSPFQTKYFLTDQAWESGGGGLQLAAKWEVGRGL